MPLDVYMAQKRRGIWSVTSAPMASSTGRASEIPPMPLRKARRSIFRVMFICVSRFRSFLEEQLARRYISDHVLHLVAACFQFNSVLLQRVEFIVCQATAVGIGSQVLQNTEGNLIN